MGPPQDSGLSVRTLVVGAALGVVFTGASMYAGMKTGVIDAGNIPAALLAFTILSAITRTRARAIEGNLVQTMSSSAAAMAITGGLVGPMAALSLTGRELALPAIVVWGIAVGVLGCLIAIPLRAAFIVHGKLPFPSGAATAEVLEQIYSGVRAAGGQIRLLFAGVAIAVAFGFVRSLLGWIPELTILPVTFGAVPAAAIYLGFGWSPLLVSIGYMIGPRTGYSLVVGAAVAWVVLAPPLVAAGLAQPDYHSLVNWLLWPGTGLLVGGTLGGIVSAWRGLRGSLREVRATQGTDGFRTRRVHVIALVLAAAVVVIASTVVLGVHPAVTGLGLALSALLCAAAARAIGETDTTPAGPLAGFAQFVVGPAAPGSIDAPLAAGGVVNGTLMQSAMLLQNWKTGALIGAPPRPQLIAQLAGVVVGAIASAVAFELIRRGYGLGNEAMPAPAARSWRATAEIVQHGFSALPAYAPLAAVIALVTGILLGLGARLAAMPSPIAMGLAFILPPYLSLTMATGALGFWLLSRWRRDLATERGMVLVSGLIAGEAIAGLAIAALMLAGISAGH